MSRLQYDQFVDDDEDECCPLCVEEFDLSDRNFRPCPCGYQICQFCYNNIKTTMNGLCPACRRPYDDSTIEFKNITPEEMAKHKQQIAQKAKKNAQIRQKEAQKAEADSLSRKHLAGLRVVQKNLVYVTGLTPTIREDRLLDTLRGPDYFGQYGKIIKIVVSKARENAQHQQSVGVYVTFARKEDAEACITAVDGSQNGDRVLRAQYGTTKYCSAYLRGEQCNNRNCMFLHEPGEDNESFTRQDLSMMNSIQTQQPAQSSSSRSAPPAHPGPPVSAASTATATASTATATASTAAAAAAPMSRQQSNEGSSPTQDAPGLPATAGWASKAALERRASRSTIASHPSPMVPNATPAQASKAQTPAPKKEEPPKVEEAPKPKTRKEEKKEERKKEKAKEKAAQASKSASPQSASESAPKLVKPSAAGFEGLLKVICNDDFKFIFSNAGFSEEDFKAIVEFPQLLDPNGGAKRRAAREREQELVKKQREAEAEAEAKAAAQPQPAPVAEPEENEATAGGSLQLGGEPEGGHEPVASHQNQHAIAPPGQQGFGGNLFGNTSLAEDFSSLGLNNRALTPAQQQQLLLSNFKSGPQSAGLLSNLQNSQNQQNLAANAPGHARHTSRFSFANDGASASANVQPVASQKIMNQQNSMMPKSATQFNQMPQHQALGGQFFTNVQGPPPGLKPTGTPPVGGTNMFAQGHGFATGGLPYGANAAGRNTNELYQDLLRNRNMDGGGARTADSGKLGTTFADEDQATLEVDALVNDDENEPVRPPPSLPLAGQFFEQPRRSTPSIPPGFTAPAIPRAIAEEVASRPGSRPGSRPMSRTTSSTIVPAVPVVPVTPIKAETPAKAKKGKQAAKAAEAVDAAPAATRVVPATPTKSPSKAPVAKAQTTTSTPTKTVEVAAKKPEKNSTPDTPVKATVKSKAASKKTEKAEKPASTAEDNSPKLPDKESADAPIGTGAPNANTKRQPPGKIDIPTTKNVEKEPTPATIPKKGESPMKNVRALPPTSSPSVPASPAVTAAPSPIKHTAAPRTLRLVSTPKAETPPAVVTPTPPLPHIPTVDKLRSRQASIASLNQPGTPASEPISDTASMTSGMISRASSPPPPSTIVGSAPVRKMTKAQAKKNRQERKRQEEETTAADEKSDVEVVQAPIIGRKKKAKKPSTTPKPVAAMASAMAAAKSQPASPKSATVEDELVETPTVASVKAQPTRNSASATPEPEVVSEEQRDRREPSAQSVLNDLQKTGEILVSALEFFKPLSSTLTHGSRSNPSGHPTSPPDLKIHFAEADLDALAKKKPIRLGGHGDKPDSRTLITPNGKFFWGLSHELEEKALSLESQIEQLAGQARFHPSSRSNTHYNPPYSPTSDVLPAIATALKEAGKKLSPGSPTSNRKLDPATYSHTLSQVHPNDLPPATLSPPPAQQQTPADAGAYLNQFVLPRTDNPPPNQSRSEMAAVGGAPGSGTRSISVATHQFEKAARAVIEGGAVGSTEIDGLGSMVGDRSGGVFVRGLESLVGAGLGVGGNGNKNGNEGREALDARLDVQGLFGRFEMGPGNELRSVSGGLGGSVGHGNGYSTATSASSRGSVLSLEEAETAMLSARREHEVLERKLAALMKKNRKLAVGGAR
ncbi:RING-type E3 ubiquitin transferase [Ascochyta rabiei]|uniref:RING-type E3 ubiquitin transferase n=1 Tax=Didymella rabiei TaxID=5454 RepID=UPI00220A7A54|nr:RING-type E3 ubiquitin transferase [Ascochyta rabiei]UPX15150.1 RING-type E3 ubiquitin transferase [Ascochyta rabiei]